MARTIATWKRFHTQRREVLAVATTAALADGDDDDTRQRISIETLFAVKWANFHSWRNDTAHLHDIMRAAKQSTARTKFLFWGSAAGRDDDDDDDGSSVGYRRRRLLYPQAR